MEKESMSKEDRIKEAVEEAKTRAAQEKARDSDDSDTEADIPEEKKSTEEPEDPEEESISSEEEGSSEEDISSGEEEKIDSQDSEDSSGSKKLFGRKKKKDKKDEKIEELTDKLTRQMAEFDNFRKRTEKEKSQMYEIGARDIIERLLPVVDNFERGLQAVQEEENPDPFAEGMKKIYKQLMTMLESIDVKPIEAVGAEFNPEFHNAVMHIEDEQFGENIVVEEFQKGYTYRSTVVRHSMVKVAN